MVWAGGNDETGFVILISLVVLSRLEVMCWVNSWFRLESCVSMGGSLDCRLLIGLFQSLVGRRNDWSHSMDQRRGSSQGYVGRLIQDISNWLSYVEGLFVSYSMAKAYSMAMASCSWISWAKVAQWEGSVWYGQFA